MNELKREFDTNDPFLASLNFNKLRERALKQDEETHTGHLHERVSSRYDDFEYEDDNQNEEIVSELDF